MINTPGDGESGGGWGGGGHASAYRGVRWTPLRDVEKISGIVCQFKTTLISVTRPTTADTAFIGGGRRDLNVRPSRLFCCLAEQPAELVNVNPSRLDRTVKPLSQKIKGQISTTPRSLSDMSVMSLRSLSLSVWAPVAAG